MSIYNGEIKISYLLIHYPSHIIYALYTIIYADICSGESKEDKLFNKIMNYFNFIK